ncbi:apyrase-like isoform X2 [Pectinophora gossypiella]|nr:apyrase-like isoform X2 [Pectinophora gossypiella]
MVLMKEKPDALLLNAGDTFQGTYWYTLLKWNLTQHFINMLPNDAHAIGNHEFDDGIAGLAPYLAALKAPVVAANIDSSKEPALHGLYKPHVILERRGRKIGIIGLITPETMDSSNPQGVTFSDPIESVKKEAQILTEKGVDIIIVLSHCGLNVDIEMAKEVGENIDIIVGGHSHSLLWNGTSPSHEKISGPYPVTVATKSHPQHKVLVVTASAMSKYLGNLTAYFDRDGELQSFDGSPVFLNRSIPEDPHIKQLLEPYKQKLYTMVRELVGYSGDDLRAEPCGSRECAVGDLATDAILNATLERYETNLPSVAFLTRNMIRGSLPKGDVTRGSVINVLPFTNKVVTFVLQGRHLVEAFENCFTNYWSFKPFNGPFLLQIAGMKVTLNSTAGQVVSAAVRVGDGYEPLDPDQDYQVTSVRFLLKGGNGFSMLKNYSRDVRAVGVDADLVEEYIRKVTPLSDKLDNRLTIVN